MKQPVILLAWCFLLLNLSAQAQTDFEETYKKARAFTTTDLDSALIWSQQCVTLANKARDKYLSYYCLAYSASCQHLFGLSSLGYQKAIKLATDLGDKYRAVNSLADVYLNAGNLDQAIEYNQQSTDYLKENKKWLSLSYAYQLKANILRKQSNYAAIDLMRDVIKLRLKHAPQQLGYAYHKLAETFQVFQVYDSAIAYQRKVLKDYPNTTPNTQALLNTQMGKYYIFNNQPKEAEGHLQVAQKLEKRPLTQAQVCHVQALYYSKVGRRQDALAEFERCDSLLETLITDAPDVVTRQTIAEQAKLLYEDALHLDSLPKMIQLSYQARLKTTEARLVSYRAKLDLADRIQQQTLLKNTQVPHENSGNWWVGVFAGVVITSLLVVGWLWYRRRTTPPLVPPTHDPVVALAINEQKLLAQLEAKHGGPIDEQLYYTVVIYYREGTIKGTARFLQIQRNTLRDRFARLSKATQIDSIKDFIDAYRAQATAQNPKNE